MSNTIPTKIGLVAVISAVLALLTVLVGPRVLPKPAVERVIADKMVEIRENVTSRIKGERQSASFGRYFKREALPYTISFVLALMAIVDGGISLFRGEDKRFAYVAFGVGAVTIAISIFARAG